MAHRQKTFKNPTFKLITSRQLPRLARHCLELEIDSRPRQGSKWLGAFGQRFRLAWKWASWTRLKTARPVPSFPQEDESNWPSCSHRRFAGGTPQVRATGDKFKSLQPKCANSNRSPKEAAESRLRRRVIGAPQLPSGPDFSSGNSRRRLEL